MTGAAPPLPPAQADEQQTSRFSFLGRGVPLAWRMLVHDRVRLAISIVGIAFAVVLVLLLRGIMDGTVAKSTTYIDHVGADVFVAEKGVSNMALATSALPEGTVQQLAEQPEVESAGGILQAQFIVTHGSNSRPAVLIAYSPQEKLGGPWKLSAGHTVEQPGEIVLDKVLADELGAKIGDEVSMVNQSFRVVGLSEQTHAIAGKHAFISLGEGQEILQLPGLVSFVLLKLRPGVDATQFADHLNSAEPALQVMSRSELSKSDRTTLGRLFVQPINVMVTIGFLVGLGLVGLTMYTTTAERLRDFGVLKAIGAPNTYLFRAVITQAVLLGAAAFIVGLAAVFAIGPIVVRAVPDIGVQVNGIPVFQTLGAMAAMWLIGAIVPVARIIRVDPLLVFKR